MWKYAHEKGILEKVAENNLPNIAIQGEFCGAGIQKNRLKLVKPEWYVFTMIDLDTHRRLPLAKMQELCKLLELNMVPIEEVKESFDYDSVEVLLERAKGKYTSGMNKEGIKKFQINIVKRRKSWRSIGIPAKMKLSIC